MIQKQNIKNRVHTGRSDLEITLNILRELNVVKTSVKDVENCFKYCGQLHSESASREHEVIRLERLENNLSHPNQRDGNWTNHHRRILCQSRMTKLKKETKFLEMPKEHRFDHGGNGSVCCDIFLELVERLRHLFVRQLVAGFVRQLVKLRPWCEVV